jgi:hypothetical protein
MDNLKVVQVHEAFRGATTNEMLISAGEYPFGSLPIDAISQMVAMGKASVITLDEQPTPPPRGKRK